MKSQLFILQGPPRDATTPALKMAAKRYTKGSSAGNTQGLTLLFTHCIGAHKEHWEPIIERLFDLRNTKDEQHRLREAWSFDYQNHGDSAVLNREALKSRPEGVSAYEWSAAMASSLALHDTQLVQLPRMSAISLMSCFPLTRPYHRLMTTKHLRPPYPHSAIVLIEPTIVTRELFNAHFEERMDQMDFAVSATLTRRDNWQSREQALKYFKKRIPWGMWDERVVKLYVKYGLENSPNGEGFTLKCDRKQESVSFPDVEPHFEGAIRLAEICRFVPIHLIWGTRNDLVPDYIQDSLSHPSEGRKVASVTKIEDAGHLVVQEKPDELALAISHILDGINIATSIGLAKL
ncbi:hypothetical protein CPB84DRAFT_1784093 [Gymnopilus junonius]|uniref:AB hydrolase-1 domain-containing protein n=1 Tax=Gymnopilus junonius TaxID=109634 RepID=A0A9P5TLL4_GYMJU|nr:hypothetical protein CPB84DRAFT_1784093 [Gymnopilus junonius]